MIFFLKNQIIIDMNVRINDNIFPGEIMSTPNELERGMMGRNSLDGCMIFKMGKGHHSFWMKGCVIPLDIVFVLNGRITKIHQNCPVPDAHQLTLPRFTGIGDHVIEFPSGTSSKFKVGDRVMMYMGTPQNPV
jgi:uncharacterized membrane protein (UPF0127 family)